MLYFATQNLEQTSRRHREEMGDGVGKPLPPQTNGLAVLKQQQKKTNCVLVVTPQLPEGEPSCFRWPESRLLESKRVLLLIGAVDGRVHSSHRRCLSCP